MLAKHVPTEQPRLRNTAYEMVDAAAVLNLHLLGHSAWNFFCQYLCRKATQNGDLCLPRSQ